MWFCVYVGVWLMLTTKYTYLLHTYTYAPWYISEIYYSRIWFHVSCEHLILNFYNKIPQNLFEILFNNWIIPTLNETTLFKWNVNRNFQVKCLWVSNRWSGVKVWKRPMMESHGFYLPNSVALVPYMKFPNLSENLI